MLHSVLAGLIRTSLNVNPDNSRYFCSKRFKVKSFYFIKYYKLVHKRLHCANAC